MAAAGGLTMNLPVYMLCLLILIMGTGTGSLRAAQAVTGNVNCVSINFKFIPCFSYLTDKSLRPAAPSQSCCTNVMALNTQFQGLKRQGVCECIKQNARSIPNLVSARVSDLSDKCGIKLGLKVNQNTDCTKACLPKPRCT
ncbi:hypothetical protein GOP47_0023059 [Adiantum capillus-veneris]|uniref:Bifunctional inhibitor/plant lipid transfer protein/seed storage helical domain-containing protein n=1 Tax=Adiantum capillus-veneris TaxID=13818 RepID=A0A9D4U7F7_ADICA|nr:hypothetical protein GOP47_0023059 [Adiantum capillus-veneris]